VPKRDSKLNSSSWRVTDKETLPRKAHVARNAMSAASTLALIAMAISIQAHADVFGPCAHQRSLEDKIAACIQAARSTSYPWVLQWVHRELARSQRERGNYRRQSSVLNGPWLPRSARRCGASWRN
jgi:hypothetical protein